MSVAASPRARPKPTIPIIVKDKTSFYWQIVLAGARQAGWDLGANVIELGADCESDINGQIRILATAVASIPAAIIIAPAQYGSLGKPIDSAATKVKIIGIACDADSMAFTSFLAADNVRAGRLAADVLGRNRPFCRQRQLSWPVGSPANAGCREGRNLGRRPALADDGGFKIPWRGRPPFGVEGGIAAHSTNRMSLEAEPSCD
jgi:Periplasmic binding protein domain